MPFNSALSLTNLFRFCGNPFRLDSWEGCSHKCSYCFQETRLSNTAPRENGPTREDRLKIALYRAFEGRGRGGLITEMLRRHVPLHFGGLSDPGQPEAIETSQKFLDKLSLYRYPVTLCTKATHFFRANPETVTFQVSISTTDEYLASILEPFAPPPKKRIAYLKQLKKEGFWTSVRISPMYDAESAMRIIDEVGQHIDFVSCGHLSLSINNKTAARKILGYLGLDQSSMESRRTEWGFPYDQRIFNFLTLKNHSPVPIGTGEGDLILLSSTDNCCGVDIMPTAFSNWMRYNAFAILRTGDRAVWYPKAGVREIVNSCSRKPGLITVRDYVDSFLADMGAN